MPLTYTPFADTPSVDRLSEDLHMNLSESERLVSGVAGFGLAAAGLVRGGLTRWALLLLGGALVQRSLSGHCALYERLELDRRHPHRAAPKAPAAQAE